MFITFTFADELDASRDRSPSFTDTNERANKLTQRMRDLYDFKTENEWPKKTSSHRENAWISKSSSEEEKINYRPIRRNSQDLEFNDRTDKKVQSEIYEYEIFKNFNGKEIQNLGN